MSGRCKKVDRLSSLPEEALSVILSLVPTKFAVRTSILSKSWRYTWTLIYNLEFDDIPSRSYSHVDQECPPSIYLPNLKTLDIIDNFKRYDININSISCDNIFKLIHGFPLLEDLSLKIHNMPGNTEDFYFKAPTLKRLRLALLYYSSNDIHKVVLNLPNLEYLHIEESFLMCSLFVMEDLSSLVKAKVSCFVFDDHLWVELLKGLSKVRNLTLDVTNMTEDAFNIHFPKFPHVKKLVIVGCYPFNLPKIPQILERFCQLEHLCVKKEYESRWRRPESFPALTFKNIVTVKYTDTTKWLAHFEAVKLLKLILKNIVDLKKMIVRYNSEIGDHNLQPQYLDAELSKFPRASRNCQIHLQQQHPIPPGRGMGSPF
ncbi:FBD-like protein [Tanacetum coccineum]